MKPIEVLRAAKKMLSKKGVWAKGCNASLPGRACASIAISRCADVYGEDEDASDIFEQAIKRDNVPEWNDRKRRTLPQVLAAFDKAIHIAKKSQAKEVATNARP